MHNYAYSAGVRSHGIVDVIVAVATNSALEARRTNEKMKHGEEDDRDEWNWAQSNWQGEDDGEHEADERWGR